MDPEFKEMTNYFMALGVDKIGHSEKTYLAHAIGVYNGMKGWGCTEELNRAGMFHSIYGTQQFQDFTLPLDHRSELQNFIGDYAEKIVFINCFMDRATLDAQLEQAEGPYKILHRETGEEMVLTKAEFDDLGRWEKRVTGASMMTY